MTTCSGAVLHSDKTTQNELSSEVGPFSMPDALKQSINTYFVALEADVGLCPILKMADKLGVGRADGKPMVEGASLTLGTNEVSPLSVAAAYAAFADRGVYCTPIVIDAVTNAQGKKLPVPKSLCSQAMSQQTADTLNTMLKGVVDDGTGTAANLPGRETAGKTGTTDNRYAAWFAGYTPNLASAVWMGDPQHKQQMINVRIGPTYYTEVQGADGPAPIWKDAMSGALASTPPQNFVTVPLNVPNPSQSPTGQNDGKHKGHGGHGGFTVMGATTGAVTGGTGPTGGGGGLPTSGGTTMGAAGGAAGGTTGGAPPPILLPSGGGGLTGGR